MEGSRTPKRQILGEINNFGLNPDSSPLSPTANLKLLTKVATNFSNFSTHGQECVKERSLLCASETPVDENTKSRKEKSLNLLCNKFLQLYPLNIPEGNRMLIPLDDVAHKLGTERRRIYDIINVLESLQMAVKAGKNQYMWYGCQNLNYTLSQLKGLALKFGYKEKVQSLHQNHSSVQFHVLSDTHDTEDDSSELCSGMKQTSLLLNFSRGSAQSTSSQLKNDEKYNQAKEADIIKEENSEESIAQINPCLCKDERSLGVLCQKFIMLFLMVDKTDLIYLDFAAKILLDETSWDPLKSKNVFESNKDKALNCESTENRDSKTGKFKTKARRLYDIANVLTSVDLIHKVRHAGSTRKPAFKYTGPNVDAISFSDRDLLLLHATRQSLLGNSINLKLGCHLACMRILDMNRAEEHVQLKKVYNNQGSRKKKQSFLSSEHESSLSKILKVAEMELQRLESRKQEDGVKAEITARKKLFPSNGSEIKAEQKTGMDSNACLARTEKIVNMNEKHHVKDIITYRNSAEVILTNNNKPPVVAPLKPRKEIRITRKLVKVSPLKVHNLSILPNSNTLMLSNVLQKRNDEGLVKQVFKLHKEVPTSVEISNSCSTKPAIDLKQSANIIRLPACTKALNEVPILFISNPEILKGKSLVFKERKSILQSQPQSNSFAPEHNIANSNITLVPLCNNTVFSRLK